MPGQNSNEQDIYGKLSRESLPIPSHFSIQSLFSLRLLFICTSHLLGPLSSPLIPSPSLPYLAHLLSVLLRFLYSFIPFT